MNAIMCAVVLTAAGAWGASVDHQPKPSRQPAQWSMLEGRVTRIIDGDTIIVTDSTNGANRVRLAGIDTPERGAPYFEDSTAALAALLADQDVLVKWAKRDKYDRIVGDVYVGPLWVNFRMVADGWATHFVKYSSDVQLANMELFAREHQLGIWANVPPPAELPVVVDTENRTELKVFSP